MLNREIQVFLQLIQPCLPLGLHPSSGSFLTLSPHFTTNSEFPSCSLCTLTTAFTLLTGDTVLSEFKFVHCSCPFPIQQADLGLHTTFTLINQFFYAGIFPEMWPFWSEALAKFTGISFYFQQEHALQKLRKELQCFLEFCSCFIQIMEITELFSFNPSTPHSFYSIKSRIMTLTIISLYPLLGRAI